MGRPSKLRTLDANTHSVGNQYELIPGMLSFIYGEDKSVSLLFCRADYRQVLGNPSESRSWDRFEYYGKFVKELTFTPWHDNNPRLDTQLFAELLRSKPNRALMPHLNVL